MSILQYFKLELAIWTHRRWLVVITIITWILLPLICLGSNYIGFKTNELAEGDFFQTQAYLYLNLVQIMLFLPVWTLILGGLEWTYGTAQRRILLDSRFGYWISRMIHAFLVSGYFTITGILTVLLALKFSPFGPLSIPVEALFFLLLQFFIVMLYLALVMETLVLITRSAFISIAIYIGWGIVENILVILITNTTSIKPIFLPLHNLQKLYLVNGSRGLENYRNPIPDELWTLLLPTATVWIIIFIGYLVYFKREIKGLSD